METKLNITEFQGKEVSQVLKTLNQLISEKKNQKVAHLVYMRKMASLLSQKDIGI